MDFKTVFTRLVVMSTKMFVEKQSIPGKLGPRDLP